MKNNKNPSVGDNLRIELNYCVAKLVEAYLDRRMFQNAYELAQKHCDSDSQDDIIKFAMEAARKDDNYWEIAKWSERQGNYGLAIKAFLVVGGETGNYTTAFLAAITYSENLKTPLLIIRNHFDQINESQIVDFLNKILVSERTLETGEAIMKIVQRLKNRYESKGEFLSAASMCEILGETGLAKTYREIETLVPKPQG